MFASVLIANRGEIAVRVTRTLARLGLRSIAVFSEADRGALHARVADVAFEIGSYLSVDDVVAAARASGADALHPGYGFLSENPALARACAAAGIAFVGPPASAIEAMGDKIAAKAMVAAAGVRVVPGSGGAGLSDDELADAAAAVGYPILLKPSAGGGGKGMRLVEHPDDLRASIASARREAAGSFGDDTLLLERFVTDPRHVEIQVLADAHGGIVHLGERECSLQRRHQKIVEEAPSPLLTAALRDRIGRQAVDAALACGYVGAGTVEFIVSGARPDEFFFMEMNTRLQVEHPVTEMVYGVDLVEEQLRVAAGEPLRLRQDDLAPTGHAIEARIYAEDPGRGFLPTGGHVHRFVSPVGDGVRVDAGIAEGSTVGSDFDPMLAKVVAWGADRAAAIDRLRDALAGTAVLGVTTNVGFLRRLLDLDEVRSGALDTGLVERHAGAIADRPAPDVAATQVAEWEWQRARGSINPWWALVGWRLGGPDSVRREFDVAGAGPVTVTTGGTGPPSHALIHRVGAATYVAIDGDVWVLTGTVHRGGGSGAAGAGAGDIVRSPMPGTVLDVRVSAGDRVAAGQPVAVVEAMKMEHTLTAPHDGVVAGVHVAAGAIVALDEPLVTVSPVEE